MPNAAQFDSNRPIYFIESAAYRLFYKVTFFLRTLNLSGWQVTYSYMQSAGFTETRSHPPLQNFAKADDQRCWKPTHMVYDSMLAAGDSLFRSYKYWRTYMFRFLKNIRIPFNFILN